MAPSYSQSGKKLNSENCGGGFSHCRRHLIDDRNPGFHRLGQLKRAVIAAEMPIEQRGSKLTVGAGGQASVGNRLAQ